MLRVGQGLQRFRAASSIIDESAAAHWCAELLPRHGDADGLLRRDEVIDADSILGDGELNALHATRRKPFPRDSYSGETGDPESSPTSQPSSAEKIIAAVAPTLPSPTF